MTLGNGYMNRSVRWFELLFKNQFDSRLVPKDEDVGEQDRLYCSKEFYKSISSWEIILAHLAALTSVRTHLQSDFQLSRFILERLIQLDAPSSVILGFLRSYPDAAKGSNSRSSSSLFSSSGSINGNWLPIHYACRYNNSCRGSESFVDVIRELLIIYPEGATKFATTTGSGQGYDRGKSGQGDLPLHLICRCRRSLARRKDILAIIKMLLNVHPKGAQQYDGCGFLPLHLLLYCEIPYHECVNLLLEAYPDAVKQADTYIGRLPIHYACLYRQIPNINIIQILVKHYPQSLHIKAAGVFPSLQGTTHRIPLELVLIMYLKRNKSTSGKEEARGCRIRRIIEFLVCNTYFSPFHQTSSADITTLDHQWKRKKKTFLPIHHAVIGGASLHIIEQLVTIFPNQLQIQDIKHNRLPHHYIFLRRQQNDDVVEISRYLFQQYPLAADVADCYGMLPFHYCALQHNELPLDQKELWFALPIYSIFYNVYISIINESYSNLGFRDCRLFQEEADDKNKIRPPPNQMAIIELLFQMLRWNPTAVMAMESNTLLRKAAIARMNCHKDAHKQQIKCHPDRWNSSLYNVPTTMRKRKGIEVIFLLLAVTAVGFFFLLFLSFNLHYASSVGSSNIINMHDGNCPVYDS